VCTATYNLNFLIIADILLYEIDINYQVVGKFLFNASCKVAVDSKIFNFQLILLILR